MSDYNYSKLLALMKVVPAYPAAAVAFRDVETIVHEQHERLTAAMGVVEEVRSMEMIVAGENPSEWDHNKVTEMVRVTEERMFIALAAYDKAKP